MDFHFHFLNTSAFKLNLWKVEKDAEGENHQFIGNLLINFTKFSLRLDRNHLDRNPLSQFISSSFYDSIYENHGMFWRKLQ